MDFLGFFVDFTPKNGQKLIIFGEKLLRGFCENFRFSANLDLQNAKRKRSERSSFFCEANSQFRFRNNAKFALRMYTPGYTVTFLIKHI